MNRRKYEKWEEFFDDVDLMINNAMIYNEDESEVFKDAEQIRVSKGGVRFSAGAH